MSSASTQSAPIASYARPSGAKRGEDATNVRASEPMIRLESVRKQYPNGLLAVRELSLDVPDGEICVLVGPSGCGKTTILRMINRLIEPTGGRSSSTTTTSPTPIPSSCGAASAT